MGKEVKCIYCNAVHTKHIENDNYICEYCGGLNFITTSQEDFNFQLAHTYLASYQFDKADDTYKQIIEEATNDKTISMAVMGRLLSYFGIVYVKSYGSNVTTPTFSKYNPEIASIKSSRYYRILSNLDIDSYELNEYNRKIEELDKVYTRIADDLNKTPEYDVFICTKISMRTKDDPNNMGYTVDSKIALDLYYTLKEKGLKVFYSDKVLQGVDYDSQIYSALSKSKTILVIASTKEYLESVWVESEWRRWLNFIDVEYRNKDTFLLYLTNPGIEVPSALQKAQIIDYYNIFDAIDAIVNKGKKKIDLEQALLDKIQKLEEENKLRAEELKKIQQSGIKAPSHVHQYEITTVPPTCLESGYTIHKCKECGDVFKDNIIAPKGHKFETIIEDATCIRDGKKEIKCTHCGLIKDSTILVKTGIHDNMLIHKVEPTCHHEGYSMYECLHCHKKSKEDVLPKLQHKWEKIIDDNKQVSFQCLLCGDVTNNYDIFFENLFEYNKLDYSYSITGINEEKFNEFIKDDDSSIIFIPSEYKGLKVTKIDDYAFANNNSLFKVVLSNNIEEIGEGAFSNCESLTIIDLGTSVKKINSSSFNNCYNLTDIQLPDSLELIGNTAFGCCESLKSINIPNSVQTIGSFAFAGCSKLEKVSLSKNIINLGEDAFAFCYLTEILIYSNDNVKKFPKTWDSSAFNDIYSIRYVTNDDK